MTNETLKNPTVVTIPDAVGIDLAIKNIQVRLANELPWLEKSFGRAWMLPASIAGQQQQVPAVYQGNQEYYTVLANDALKSYSFWRTIGARNLNEYLPLTNGNIFFLTDPVDLIFWVNLNTIDPSKNYIFKEELIQSVLRTLNKDPNVVVLRIWDDRVDDIFRGYTLYQSHRDLLMYPFQAFRFELNLRYEFSC